MKVSSGYDRESRHRVGGQFSPIPVKKDEFTAFVWGIEGDYRGPRGLWTVGSQWRQFWGRIGERGIWVAYGPKIYQNLADQRHVKVHCTFALFLPLAWVLTQLWSSLVKKSREHTPFLFHILLGFKDKSFYKIEGKQGRTMETIYPAMWMYTITLYPSGPQFPWL